MITYERLWKTMEKRGITQYTLYERYNIPRSLLHRLRNNMNIETNTLDRLCTILKCNVEDICEHIPDTDESEHIN